MNQAFMQCSVMGKWMVSQAMVARVIMEPKSMVSQTHGMMSHTMVPHSKMSNPMMTQTHPMVSNSMVPKTMVSMACSKMDNRVSSSMHCMVHRFMVDHWILMHYVVLLMHMHKRLEGRKVLLCVGKGRHWVRRH